MAASTAAAATAAAGRARRHVLLGLLACCCCSLGEAPHIGGAKGADAPAKGTAGGTGASDGVAWPAAAAAAMGAAARPVAGGALAAGQRVLTLPLSRTNILALSVLLLFSMLGCVFLWKLVTRKKCNCKLCNQQYLIAEAIGSGGYGQVFTVTRQSDEKVLVMKKIRVDDITDANFAQAEARELRMLKHPRIVGYSDDFVHVEFMSGMQGHMDLEPLFFLVIVMEYCPEGDLSSRIADAYGK